MYICVWCGLCGKWSVCVYVCVRCGVCIVWCVCAAWCVWGACMYVYDFTMFAFAFTLNFIISFMGEIIFRVTVAPRPEYVTWEHGVDERL